MYLFRQKEKRSKSERDENLDIISLPSPCILRVSQNLKAWLGVLALPIHRVMTTGKRSFFTSLSLSLLICKLGIGLPWWLSAKEPACQYRRCKGHRYDPWVRKIPWNRKWQPAAVFLPGEFHGQRSLAGYNPWGRKKSDTDN